jgi:hypothetical protein
MKGRHLLDDLRQAVFNREVAGIQAVHIGIRQVL